MQNLNYKNIIEAKGVCKSFGDLQALDNISFSVRERDIFGIIGPDGAGKSTLFRILTTLLLADSGECRVAGLDVAQNPSKIRQIVGYMPGNFSLYMDLSVQENLNFFASIYGTSLEENYHLISAIYSQLEPFKNRRAKALSGGMKQKLALCCALIHKPEILFLDEPTTGVDAVSRQEFWEILKSLKSQMSIIVSTPYMDEASLCDRIALLYAGRFLKFGTPRELCESFPHKLYALKNLPPNALDSIRGLDFVHSCFLFGESYHIALKDSATLGSLREFFDTHFSGVEVSEIGAGIEDCFMEFLI